MMWLPTGWQMRIVARDVDVDVEQAMEALRLSVGDARTSSVVCHGKKQTLQKTHLVTPDAKSVVCCEHEA
jgi:ABC-type uncharacterized transport system ATPase subunit